MDLVQIYALVEGSPTRLEGMETRQEDELCCRDDAVSDPP